jgi:hypothetical protein
VSLEFFCVKLTHIVNKAEIETTKTQRVVGKIDDTIIWKKRGLGLK